jgi:hypothetical protein
VPILIGAVIVGKFSKKNQQRLDQSVKYFSRTPNLGKIVAKPQQQTLLFPSSKVPNGVLNATI